VGTEAWVWGILGSALPAHFHKFGGQASQLGSFCLNGQEIIPRKAEDSQIESWRKLPQGAVCYKLNYNLDKHIKNAELTEGDEAFAKLEVTEQGRNSKLVSQVQGPYRVAENAGTTLRLHIGEETVRASSYWVTPSRGRKGPLTRLIPIFQLGLHRNVSQMTGNDRNVGDLRNPGPCPLCGDQSRQGIHIGYAFALIHRSYPRRMSRSSRTGNR
jgi:hypothetical protein